jgi:hypothetical protein
VNTLSPTTIAALAGAGVLLIGAFFGGIVQIVTAFKTYGSVRAIEGHVNSEKTAAEGREMALKQEVALLREIISGQKQTAAVLAQAASHPVAAATAVLDKIETNTAATAEGVQHLSPP